MRADDDDLFDDPTELEDDAEELDEDHRGDNPGYDLDEQEAIEKLKGDQD